MKFNTKKFNELNKVLNIDEPCISIYVPTHRAGNVQEDKLRFKNAISEAVEKLVEGKMFQSRKFDKKEAQKFLTAANQLLKKDEFWLHLSDTLVVFMDDTRFEYYTVPIKTQGLVYIGSGFYLRHMLPIISEKEKFFLLALSQGELRFFSAHQHAITPVKISDLVPESIQDIVTKHQTSTLQSHSVGSNAALYHGQGARKDKKDTELVKYFREIDRGLMEMLHDESSPMVIAGVDYLIPIYMEISNYPHILEEHISGNPEDDGPVLLHEKAWDIVGKNFQEQQNEKKQAFTDYLIEGKASTDLKEIVAAAHAGKVESLYVDKDAGVSWGFHKQLTNHAVMIHKAQNDFNYCLLDYAARETHNNGGNVYSIAKDDLPDARVDLNAIFRF